MIANETLIRDEFRFLRINLLTELERQITLRTFNSALFDEVFERHMYTLIQKIEGKAKEIPTESQTTLPETSQAPSLEFPSLQRKQ